MIGVAVLALLALLAVAAAAPGEVYAYKVILEVETTSDWTHVAIDGFSPTLYKVVEGSNAPQLTVEVLEGEIRLHKRQYDTTLVRLRVEGWLTFTHEEVAVKVTKGDLGYTTVRVYTMEKGVENLVWNFTNKGIVEGSGGLNPRTSRIPRSLFYKAKGRIVKVRERAAPKLVLAFYYPWYGNPQGASGRWFHWERVSYEDIGSSTDYPLLGPYDSWDKRVIRSHIRMAKAAGIDGFVCSWWGIGTFEDEAFSRMLDVAAEEGFNLTIYYESVRDMPMEQVVEELSYVLEKYSKHPAFLKLEDKPVVFIYAVEAKGRDLNFWRKVLDKVEEKTKISAIYIGDTFNTVFLSVFDGIHTYNPIWIKDHGETYTKVAARVKSFIALNGEAVRKLWVATTCPGYDDRKIRKPGTYVSREEGRYYEITWEAAIRSGADMVLICTWNEWHEGTEVEPSVEYGFSYLRLTRSFVERYKGFIPPTPAPPVLDLSLYEEEDKVVVVIENRGGAAVITRLTLVNAQLLSVNEPEDLHVYRLPVTSTSYALFIPFLDSGEKVVLECRCLGKEVSVKLESWSAVGEKVAGKESLKVKGYSTSNTSGFPLSLLVLAAAVIAASLAALFTLLFKSGKRIS